MIPSNIYGEVFPIDAREKIMAMLTVYLDESGTDGRSPIVAVGGYVSTVDRWCALQHEWQKLLKDENISIFHTSDLLSQEKEFKGWSKARAQRVAKTADRIIKKHVLFGIASYTLIADCEELFPLKGDKRTNRKARKKFSAEYLFSGMATVLGVVRWARENGHTEPIRYVFEYGANGRGYLSDAMRYAEKSDEGARFLIGGYAFEKKECVVQLQPADRLTWSSCNMLITYVRNKRATRERVIKSMIQSKVKTVLACDKERLEQILATCKELEQSL